MFSDTPASHRWSPLVRALSIALALVLLAGIVWASMDSDVVQGLRYLAADRWGLVTLLDVYSGAFVVAVWICARERSMLARVVWIVALLSLGHLVSLIYLAWRFGRRPAAATQGRVD